MGTAEQLTHHTTPFLTHTSAYLPHFWLSDNLNGGICVQWEPDLKVRIAIAYRLILHLLLMNLGDGVEDGTFSTLCLLQQSLTLARAKCLMLNLGQIIMIRVYYNASSDFIWL